jgi:rhodanese-related sulfurtransferase
MMRARLVFGPLAVIAFALAGCSGESEAAIPVLSVGQVASMLERGEITPVDANGDETRRERGTLPGARLLSSSSQYDPAAELPADKSAALVFYCGNTQCTASDTAAERAREAGYANVNVMRAGIAGWVEAGKDVDHPES